MRELYTIESERYEPGEQKGTVKVVGMISPQEMFEALEKHLKEVNLLPDEYFIPASFSLGVKEIPEFYTAICHTDWGGSEGIYLDILLQYREKDELKLFPLATGKTLGATGDDFLRMSRIAAECSMMINGRGWVVEIKEEKNNDTIHLTEHEKGLISKALDFMGDKVADSHGYSAGEEYWDIKAKLEGNQLQPLDAVIQEAQNTKPDVPNNDEKSTTIKQER